MICAMQMQNNEPLFLKSDFPTFQAASQIGNVGRLLDKNVRKYRRLYIDLIKLEPLTAAIVRKVTKCDTLGGIRGIAKRDTVGDIGMNERLIEELLEVSLLVNLIFSITFFFV